MRSIGKRNIKKLQAIVKEEYNKKDLFGGSAYFGQNLRTQIESRIPEEWYDIWESAHNEIHRTVDDTITNLMYKR